MANQQRIVKRRKPKTVLRLPDLEQSKNAVLNSLAATSSQESYSNAIDEFIGWYCSEPRLSFNRTVVLRYRFFLEQKNLAPSTINVRRAAVRRLAYEGSDTGLLSPELAAGIRRVKGAKRLGVGKCRSTCRSVGPKRRSGRRCPDDCRGCRGRTPPSGRQASEIETPGLRGSLDPGKHLPTRTKPLPRTSLASAMPAASFLSARV
jgi:hypothetical protein